MLFIIAIGFLIITNFVFLILWMLKETECDCPECTATTKSDCPECPSTTESDCPECPTGSYYSDGNMGLRKINQYAQVYNERATFPEPRGDGWSRARNNAGEYHLSCAPNSYYGNFENNGKQYSYCVLPPN